MPTIRNENWVFDDSGMYSTAVVQVRTGEKVWVSEEIAQEFELDTKYGVEVADGARERFAWEFDYARVRAALRDKGYERADPS